LVAAILLFRLLGIARPALDMEQARRRSLWREGNRMMKHQSLRTTTGSIWSTNYRRPYRPHLKWRKRQEKTDTHVDGSICLSETLEIHQILAARLLRSNIQNSHSPSTAQLGGIF